MICDVCKVDKLISDYINSTNICFKCMYQKKLEKSREKRTPKPVICRICSAEVVRDKNIKKRQRTVFCSDECAEKGRVELMNNYWTRKVRSGRSYYGK
jgi:hypothetical protein